MGELGFLTPNFPPEHKFYTRKLLIPATSEFLALVNGALLELCHEWNWEKDGEMTEAETAEYFLNMWQQYTHNVDEPPTWETPDDVDGQPEQPWYDTLADWIIEGFLAVTFTPQAALVYSSTVPRLRVAIRTGNIGALFRVLINGVEVWTGDSYAPITDILSQNFDMSAETEPYTVRIEHNGAGENVEGDAKLEVIRESAVAEMVQTILRGDPGGCGVQWSTDDGGTWNTIDLASCITGLANDAILQAISDGVIAKGNNQPGPSSPPEPEACQTFHVKLAGNDRWLCPFPVSTNFTITVSNKRGGWSDGSADWFCSDGSRYYLGICDDTGKTHNEGDPLADETHHMELIAQVGNDFFNPGSGTYEITGLYISQPLWFQANDGSLEDNQGAIEFDVEICSSSDVWSHEFDFTLSEQGWESVSGSGWISWGASWYAPLGENTWWAAQYFAIQIQVPETNAVITSWSATSQRSAGDLILRQYSTPDDATYDWTANQGSGHSAELTEGHYLTLLGINNAGIGCQHLYLTGTGIDPF